MNCKFPALNFIKIEGFAKGGSWKKGASRFTDPPCPPTENKFFATIFGNLLFVQYAFPIYLFFTHFRPFSCHLSCNFSLHFSTIFIHFVSLFFLPIFLTKLSSNSALILSLSFTLFYFPFSQFVLYYSSIFHQFLVNSSFNSTFIFHPFQLSFLIPFSLIVWSFKLSFELLFVTHFSLPLQTSLPDLSIQFSLIYLYIFTTNAALISHPFQLSFLVHLWTINLSILLWFQPPFFTSFHTFPKIIFTDSSPTLAFIFSHIWPFISYFFSCFFACFFTCFSPVFSRILSPVLHLFFTYFFIYFFTVFLSISSPFISATSAFNIYPFVSHFSIFFYQFFSYFSLHFQPYLSFYFLFFFHAFSLVFSPIFSPGFSLIFSPFSSPSFSLIFSSFFSPIFHLCLHLLFHLFFHLFFHRFFIYFFTIYFCNFSF